MEKMSGSLMLSNVCRWIERVTYTRSWGSLIVTTPKCHRGYGFLAYKTRHNIHKEGAEVHVDAILNWVVGTNLGNACWSGDR